MGENNNQMIPKQIFYYETNKLHGKNERGYKGISNFPHTNIIQINLNLLDQTDQCLELFSHSILNYERIKLDQRSISLQSQQK